VDYLCQSAEPHIDLLEFMGIKTAIQNDIRKLGRSHLIQYAGFGLLSSQRPTSQMADNPKHRVIESKYSVGPDLQLSLVIANSSR
jgi:hypothetical protein